MKITEEERLIRRRVSSKKYRESHKERGTAYKKKYMEEHKEELKIKNRLYRDAHKKERQEYRRLRHDLDNPYRDLIDTSKCSVCKLSNEGSIRRGGMRIGVHHKDCDRSNNSKDNLIAVCASCHAYIHWKLETIRGRHEILQSIGKQDVIETCNMKRKRNEV